MRKIILGSLIVLATTGAFAQKGGGGGGSHGGGAASSGSASSSHGGTLPTGGVYNNGGNYGYGNGAYSGYGMYGPYGYNTRTGMMLDPSTGVTRPMSTQEERLARAMEKQRNTDRQRKMLADSDRLADLAASVNKDVTNADGKLSADSMRNASEVEKLAKSVQRKMSGQD